MAQVTIQKRNGGEAAGAVRPRSVEPFSLMRDLLRWDPFREVAPVWPVTQELRFQADFDVKETKDAFLFKADLPGVREQDLEVTVTGTRLTIAGKRDEEKEDKGDTYYTYERSQGSFTRSFTLPEEADVEHLHAELKEGVLTLVVPKRPAAVAKKVTINTGDKPKG